MKKCPNCGCMEFQVHQTEDHVIVVNSDGEFVKEESAYTQIVHEPTDNDMWQCDDCGFTAQGLAFNMKEPKVSQDNIVDMKREIVALLEEELEEHDAFIPNEERDQAIRNGANIEELGHIYGSDFDTIGSIVENMAEAIQQQKSVEIPLIVNAIMKAYEQVAAKAVSVNDPDKPVRLSFTDICGLKDLVLSVFESYDIS